VVDPNDITNFNRTPAQLEEFWLFGLVVQGKTAKVQAKKLELTLGRMAAHIDWGVCLDWQKEGYRPFDMIQHKHSSVRLAMEWAKLGCYNRMERAFTESANELKDVLDIAPLEMLEEIHGVGPKTARMFMLHSRPHQRLAVLDVHILRWLTAKGYDVPSATPSSQRRYVEMEGWFLDECDNIGVSPAALDLAIWSEYERFS